jgi:hypothetical protein
MYMGRDDSAPAARRHVIDRLGGLRDDPCANSASLRVSMNKSAVAAAALLGVALLVLPGIVGSVIEANVRDRIAAIDANPNATAALQSFDRGWFRSTARIELSLAPDNVAQLADAAGTPLGVFGS